MINQTINELANFSQRFKIGEINQLSQSNLIFNDVINYFLEIWKKM